MGKSAINIDLPNWYEDKLYQSTQDILFPLGKNLLEGNIPDYYKGIGEYGGQELNDLLGLATRDTTRAVEESYAARGIGRSGLVGAAVAPAVADIGTKLRWEDYQRALQGKQWLFGEGRGITEGVRAGALDITGMRNQFNLGRSQLELGMAQSNAQAKAQKDAMWGQILSSVIGTAGMIVAGPVGAAAGAVLGSATGSGVSNISGQVSLPSSGYGLLS